MLNDEPIKVGDDLVEYGKVYKVFKIADKKMYDGKTVKHVFFKPIYDTADNQTLSCAVPIKNIKQANIRRPFGKKKLTQILKILSNGEFSKDDMIEDVNEAKELLKKNSPRASAKVLRSIYIELNDEELNATKSRKDVFELSMKILSQEVALAFGLTLDKAQAKLERALKKSLS